MSRNYKYYFIIPCLIFLNCKLFSQSFQEELNKEKDSLGKLSILKNWEKSTPDDSEVYIAYFNYYIEKSRETGTKGNKHYGKPGKTDSIINANVVIYNSKFLKEAFFNIDKAIKIKPNRIDIREGKIYYYAMLEQWNDLTNEIITLLNYSNQIRNNWVSKEDKPIENPKKTLLNLVSKYQYNLYYFAQTDNENLFNISKTVYKYYPDYIENLFFLSECYRFDHNYNKSIEISLEAYKLDPTNFNVIKYLAENYQKNGETKKALEFYNLAYKYSDQESAEKLKITIQELEKK